ncbi:MAG: hypothetical protein GY799_21440 [Desulfobulbaceae bacterium]|nr:hypothetical protein [Desulfobulbaceae bacterium]
MALWPVNDKCTGIEEIYSKPANKKKSKAGYTMSFPAGTVAKRELMVEFGYLSYSEKASIQAFFNLNQGNRFTMNHPDPNSSEVLTLIFLEDQLSFKYVRVFPGEYLLSLKVREA